MTALAYRWNAVHWLQLEDPQKARQIFRISTKTV